MGMLLSGGMRPGMAAGGDISIAQPTQSDADAQSFTFATVNNTVGEWRYTLTMSIPSTRGRIATHGVYGRTVGGDSLFVDGTAAYSAGMTVEAASTGTTQNAFDAGLDTTTGVRAATESGGEGEGEYLKYTFDSPVAPLYVDNVVGGLGSLSTFNNNAIYLDDIEVVGSFEFFDDQKINYRDANFSALVNQPYSNFYRTYFKGEGESVTVYPRYFRTANVVGTDATHRPAGIRLIDGDDSDIPLRWGVLFGDARSTASPYVFIDGNAATYLGINNNVGHAVGVVMDVEYGSQIAKYAVKALGPVGYMGSGWDEQISFDGIWWFTVGSRSGLTWASGEEKTFTIGA